MVKIKASEKKIIIISERRKQKHQHYYENDKYEMVRLYKKVIAKEQMH